MDSRGFESTLIDQYSKLELEGEDRTAWEDGLSYCTWNGLGADLGEDKILKALDELERAGVRSKYMYSCRITRYMVNILTRFSRKPNHRR